MVWHDESPFTIEHVEKSNRFAKSTKSENLKSISYVQILTRIAIKSTLVASSASALWPSNRSSESEDVIVWVRVLSVCHCLWQVWLCYCCFWTWLRSWRGSETQRIVRDCLATPLMWLAGYCRTVRGNGLDLVKRMCVRSAWLRVDPSVSGWVGGRLSSEITVAMDETCKQRCQRRKHDRFQ